MHLHILLRKLLIYNALTLAVDLLHDRAIHLLYNMATPARKAAAATPTPATLLSATPPVGVARVVEDDAVAVAFVELDFVECPAKGAKDVVIRAVVVALADCMAGIELVAALTEDAAEPVWHA